MNRKEEKSQRQENQVHQILKPEQVQLTSRKIKEPTDNDISGNLTDKEEMAREKALLDADERKKNQIALEKEIIKDKSKKNQRN